jgi:GTP-binding protein
MEASMKITSAEFITSAASLDVCPTLNLPEFALIGRSNVGKSSLLNLLTNRNELARTSNKPGYTKLINFFHINRDWCLVDLPGYGFVTDGKKHRDRFNNAVADYLAAREELCCVFVLIDSSLPPQEVDLEFIHWLTQQSVPFVLIFTKTDKVSATRVEEHIEQFKVRMTEFADNLPLIFKTSSKARTGQVEVLKMVGQVIANQNKQNA